MILATSKQVAYLQALADKAERIKTRHPSLIPQGLFHTRWEEHWPSSDKASLCIQFYLSILAKAESILHPVHAGEDIPE